MSEAPPRDWKPDHGQIPHSRAIGMRLIEIGAGASLMCVPYDRKLVGNPATGVLHGGVITSVLDSASGVAVGSALASRREANEQGWRPIATLDLRIDYMKPATPGKDVMARAECYKLTRNVAFVRGVAYHDDPADPIATSTATFMLSTPDRDPGRAVSEPFDRLSHFGDVESLHALLENTPYTKMLGIGVLDDPSAPVEGGLQSAAADGTRTPVFVLRFSADIIGNVRLPAIHGGVIGAFLETTALATLIWASDSAFLPKTIDITIEYLRSGRPRDTFAQATITKHGRRVANVSVVAWQEDVSRPIAAAHGHFLIKPREDRGKPREERGPEAGSGA